MVGMSEPVGVGKAPPGEGKSGAISGDRFWKGEIEDGEGSVFVADEVVGSVGSSGIGSDCEYDERIGEGMKSMMIISTG